MNDYPSNLPPLPQQSRLNDDAGLRETQNAILKSYFWMFFGLLITAVTSGFFAWSGLLYRMLVNFPMLSWILLIAQLGLVMVLSFAAGKLSAAAMKGLFVLYAFTMGISLASVFYIYTGGTLFLAFGISAAFFGLLTITGFTARKNLASIGRISLIGLLVLLVSQILMMIFHISVDVRIVSAIGLLLFAGITCWDVQRLNQTMLYYQGQPVAQQKWAILFALELYLDFLNIFLYILQLLGSGSGSKR